MVLSHNAEEVEFSFGEGILRQNDGALRRVTPGGAWNAAVASEHCIVGLEGDLRGVAFEVAGVRGDVFVALTGEQGLAEERTWQGLDFGLYMACDSTFYIFERCGAKFRKSGTYAAGDKVQVLIASDNKALQYVVNDEVRYTSSKELCFPLHVKICADTNHPDSGLLVREVRWLRATARVLTVHVQEESDSSLLATCYSIAGDEIAVFQCSTKDSVLWLRQTLSQKVNTTVAPLRLVDRWARVLDSQDMLQTLVCKHRVQSFDCL